jgi:hypothetical protein
MKPNNPDIFWLREAGAYALVAALGWAVLVILAAGICAALARDLGQWEYNDPAIREWFQELKQPDTISMGRGISCCGESDAYWADEVHVRGGKTFAVITDDRPDDPLMRIHEEIGTEYEVPPRKIVGLEQRVGNPTGHTLVFLGTKFWDKAPRPVLCYVMNSGS